MAKLVLKYWLTILALYISIAPTVIASPNDAVTYISSGRYSTYDLKTLAPDCTNRPLYSQKHIGDSFSSLTCEQYEVFSEKILGKNMFVVFASEYYGSSASLLGHISIAFGDTVPEYVASFATTSLQKPFFNMLADVFITGGDSQVTLETWNDTKHRYRDNENRTLWYFQTKLKPSDIDLIARRLFFSRIAPPSYFYHSFNCADFVLDLFLPFLDSNHEYGVTAPYEVLKVLRSNDILGKSYVIPSSEWIVNALYKNFDDSSKIVVKNAIQDGKYDGDNVLLLKLFNHYNESDSRRNDILTRAGQEDIKIEIINKPKPSERSYISAFNIEFSDDHSLSSGFSAVTLDTLNTYNSEDYHYELKFFDIGFNKIDSNIQLNNLIFFSNEVIKPSTAIFAGHVSNKKIEYDFQNSSLNIEYGRGLSSYLHDDIIYYLRPDLRLNIDTDFRIKPSTSLNTGFLIDTLYSSKLFIEGAYLIAEKSKDFIFSARFIKIFENSSLSLNYLNSMDSDRLFLRYEFRI